MLIDLKKYTKSKNFEIYEESVSVPHSYCITHHHVLYTSKNCMGRMDKEAITKCEKAGIHCGVKDCDLLFFEHKKALAVKCYVDDQKLLKEFLEANIKQCRDDNFKGFVLVDHFTKI
jgi:hypothetical protein